MTLLKQTLAQLAEHSGRIAVIGSVSGWFSWETIAHAKDVAQFLAGSLAALVSLCALIITGPQAVARVRGWIRALFQRQ